MLMHAGGLTTNDFSEPYAKIYSHEDRGNFFLTEYFVDLLKSTNDPRLSLIGTVCEEPTISVQAGSDFQYGNSDPAVQKGLPSGFSDSPDSPWFVGNKYPEFKDEDYRSTYRSRYSTINRYTYSDSTGPTFVCTYAQTQLLLAEAAVRGWVDGSAQTYYENGVRAACGSSHSSPTARRCIISI